MTQGILLYSDTFLGSAALTVMLVLGTPCLVWGYRYRCWNLKDATFWAIPVYQQFPLCQHRRPDERNLLFCGLGRLAPSSERAGIICRLALFVTKRGEDGALMPVGFIDTERVEINCLDIFLIDQKGTTYPEVSGE